MKFACYDDYLRWSNEIEQRQDLTAEEKEQLIVSVYAENGGICGMSLLKPEENKMKTNTVLAKLPIGYNDFGSTSLNEKGFQLMDHLLSTALPDDLVICGDEVIGPVDFDFCQDDFDAILDSVCEQLISSDDDIWDA